MVDRRCMCTQFRVGGVSYGWLLIVVSLLWLTPLTSYAGAISEVSSTSITDQDFLTLRVTLEGDFTGELDTAELEKNFDIDNQSINQSHSIINGRVSRYTQWTLSLLPKKTGLLAIPEFQLGKDRTQKIVVQVSAGNDIDSNSPIQLSAEIETPTPYVQQPVMINLKLLYRDQVSNAKFQFPDTNGAILDNLADPVSSKVRLGGVNYTQWEQKLMLIPQRPGKLELDAISFRADLITQDFRRRPMIRRTEPLVFEVKNIPTSYPKDAPWLPAKSVTVSDSLNANAKLAAQEPFTRTITIKAIGNTAGAVPTLESKTHPQFKQYPEPVTEETVFENNQLMGTKSLSVAMIPLSGNQATLPAITVHWWDLNKDQLALSTIDEKTVGISGGAAMPEPATSVPALVETETEEPTTATATPTPEVDHPSPKSWWQEASTFIAAGAIILWLLTIATWLTVQRSRNANRMGNTTAVSRLKTAEEQKKDSKAQLESARRAVHDACGAADAKKATESLLKWFGLAFPDEKVHSISALIPLAENLRLKQALKDLETHLYRDPDLPWDARTIERHFTELKPRDTQPTVLGTLEPLYLDDNR